MLPPGDDPLPLGREEEGLLEAVTGGALAPIPRAAKVLEPGSPETTQPFARRLAELTRLRGVGGKGTSGNGVGGGGRGGRARLGAAARASSEY